MAKQRQTQAPVGRNAEAGGTTVVPVVSPDATGQAPQTLQQTVGSAMRGVWQSPGVRRGAEAAAATLLAVTLWGAGDANANNSAGVPLKGAALVTVVAEEESQRRQGAKEAKIQQQDAITAAKNVEEATAAGEEATAAVEERLDKRTRQRDRARGQRDALQADLNSAKADLATTQADLAKAQTDIIRLTGEVDATHRESRAFDRGANFGGQETERLLKAGVQPLPQASIVDERSRARGYRSTDDEANGGTSFTVVVPPRS